MPFKDPEAKRAWRREHAQKNAEANKAYSQSWSAANPEKVAEYGRRQAEKMKWSALVYRLFRAKIDEVQSIKIEEENKDQRHRRVLRDRVVDFLGGRCKWCGFDVRLCLEVDHIEPVKRRTNGWSTYHNLQYYRSILSGEETNAQLLCSNCHTLKARLDREYGNGDVEVAFDPYADLVA